MCIIVEHRLLQTVCYAVCVYSIPNDSNAKLGRVCVYLNLSIVFSVIIQNAFYCLVL